MVQQHTAAHCRTTPCTWPVLTALAAAAASSCQVDGRLQPVLQQPPSSVLWCPIDPDPEPADAAAAAAAHPLFFDARLPPPLRVEVTAGDVL